MRLHDICSNDFILVQSDQTIKIAKEAIERLKPSSIIVRRWSQGEVYYYLYTVSEFLQIADNIADDLSLDSSKDLFLHERSVTPSLDAYQDAETLPPKCIVIDKDRVIGFYEEIFNEEIFNEEIFLPSKGIRSSESEAEVESTCEEPSPEPISRSVKADFPEKVALGEISSLLVRLTSQSVQNKGIPVNVPLGTELDIVIEAVQGFSLVGSGEGRLRVTSEEETLPIQFKLRATKIGPGRIRILAFNSGQPLGSITLAPIIVAEDQIISEQRYSEVQPLAPLPTALPDLTLIILEKEFQKDLAIDYYLTASDPNLGLYWKQFGPIILKTMNPLQYFQDFFKDIEGMRLDGPRNQKIAAERLAHKGAALYNSLLPEDLRVILWNLKDHISTVQVLSDEPWIPWELLKLQGKQGNRVVEGQYISEAFEITRWFPGIGRRPKLSLKNIALVVPNSGLPNAQSECSYLLSIAGNQRKVSKVPANYLDITEALSKGEYDTWHFTGHGRFETTDPNRSEIKLEDQPLSPMDINGVVRNCGLARPLVFLNACQTGREAFSLTGIGGWAKSFIEAGAAGFIGSLWSVGDEAAYKFSKAFYSNLLSGMSIGSAVKKARDSIKPNSTSDSNDPTTWLAYTVFADPLATIQ